MSFLAPTGSQWRTPEYGKSVIVSTYRGVTRIQAWPRPRGAAKTVDEAFRRWWFGAIQKWIKLLHPRETEYERKVINNHNRTHKGQRGSAAIRLRDWQTQRLMGRGIAIDVPGLHTLYPPAVVRTASDILDHCTDEPGQILQRVASTWGEIPPGTPGQVLTSQGPGLPNLWAQAV